MQRLVREPVALGMMTEGKRKLGTIAFFVLVGSVVAAVLGANIEGYYSEPLAQVIMGWAITGAVVGWIVALQVVRYAEKLPRRVLPPFLRSSTAEELFTRNQDIVDAYVAMVTADSRPDPWHLTSQCLSAIAWRKGCRIRDSLSELPQE